MVLSSQGRCLLEPRPGSIGGLQYNGFVLLQSLRASALIKSDSKLSKVLELGMDSVFPMLVSKALKASLSDPRLVLPSKFTKQRGRLYLDIAILLQDRRFVDSEGIVVCSGLSGVLWLPR